VINVGRMVVSLIRSERSTPENLAWRGAEMGELMCRW